MNCLNN